MQIDYPFITDYAKSDRSRCKLCKSSIEKNSLRLAAIVQAPKFDGKMTNWFHFDCFFKKNKVKAIENIQNIEKLRWEDQEKIKLSIGVSSKVAETFKYGVDYAKSKGTTCKKCEAVIEMGSLRMYRNKKAKGTLTQWYHVHCFVLIIKIPDDEVTMIDGFEKLKKEDSEDITKQFLNSKNKKRACNDKNECFEITKKSKTDDLSETKEFKKQNEVLWHIRDGLEREIQFKSLGVLLQYNDQLVPSGKSNMLDALSDAMVFGCLNRCKECKGYLSYSSNKYKCVSFVNEWTKCLYETKDVQRSEFNIPLEFMNFEIMKNYRYVVRDRFILKDFTTTVIEAPLKGFVLVAGGNNWNNCYTLTKVKEKIKDLGGILLKNVGPDTAVMIYGSKDDMRKKIKCDSKNLRLAQQFNVDVVGSEIFQDLENGEDFVKSVKKRNCVEWGRSEEELRHLKTSGMEYYNKYVGSSTIKDGSLVDSDSNLEHVSHVYRDPESDEIYNAVLGMVDIVRGNNSVYKLQLLESNSQKKWWVYRSWGRIGTTIGDNKKESFNVLREALQKFDEIYFEKTENFWKNRHQFKKQLNRFYPMDIDYGEDKMTDLSVQRSIILPHSVDELVRFIFDIESMKRTMVEFEIDLKKLPLGKLSSKQIELAYGVLNELQDLLTRSNPPTKTQLLEASTKFYTFLPHDFGMKAPTIIDSLKIIEAKVEMMDSLKEIEIAYKLMNHKNDERNANITTDNCYNKLRNKINVVERGSDEFLKIETYLRNSHGSSHNSFKLEIKEIFDLCRENEDQRFEKFKSLPNHMMLWHGSRRTNWAGILSQGLRIAPPEAPPTGYMFGKGIYFADMVSKSANYCNVTHSSEGLLLLCEVALGNMTERVKADPDIKLNENEHSCKGVGATAPNPLGNVQDEGGVVYPLGTPTTQSSLRSSLLYNEYIVYDEAQVRQRYILKVHFNYK